MKMILFASALALSTAAIAQDTTPAPTMPADAGAATNTPPAMPATPDASAPATPGASAPSATTDASMPAATPAPDASAMPATAPDATAPAATTDDSGLPTCSKTVNDKCKQGGKGMTMHHKPVKHKKMAKKAK